MKRLVVLALLLGATLGQSAALAAAEKAAEERATAALDLSQLDLRAIEARIAPSLDVKGVGILKAPAGGRIVLVTLRGATKEKGKLELSAKAFSTLYSIIDQSTPNAQEKVAKAQATAVDLGDGVWSPETSVQIAEPREVTLGVAVPMAAPTNLFYLLYDTAKGRMRVAVHVGPAPTSPHRPTSSPN